MMTANNPFISNHTMLPIASMNKIKILIDNKHFSLVELLSASSFKKSTDNQMAIDNYSNILLELLCAFRLNDGILVNDDWEQVHWEYWSNVNEIIFCGGILESKLGQAVIEKLKDKIRLREIYYDISSAKNSRHLSIVGCGKKLSQVYSKGLLFDFGHTSIKRGVLNQVSSKQFEIVLQSGIPSKLVEWLYDLNVNEANELHKYIINIISNSILGSIFCADEDIYIAMSIANYISDGHICNRGGYAKLRLLAGNYQLYLQEELSRVLDRNVNVMMIHDATAASYGVDTVYKDVAVISLGTALGISFTQHEQQSIISESSYEIIAETNCDIL